MSRDFIGALLQLNAEKGVPQEHLVRTVEDAIQSAYRRFSGDEDVHVRIDPESGRIRVFRARRVVAEIEDEATEMTVEQAHAYQADAEVGDLVETEELDPEHFGRIHAQTAKQVVLQRLREAERDVVFEQYANREGELITGTVKGVEPRAIILDVGKAEAILAVTEQSAMEHYRIGQNVKAYVLEVRRSTKGPQVLVSRTHKGFLRRLFELEVPEIHNGTVEIKAIAREPGSRSKVAVASRQEGLDPVGATVGQRGARVQAVVAELGGEKVDVIPWNEDPAVFVASALSPAQVVGRPDRRGEPHRVRHGPGADALARHRPRGPERAARREAHRLADRHPLGRPAARGARARRGRGAPDACPGARRGRRLARPRRTSRPRPSPPPPTHPPRIPRPRRRRPSRPARSARRSPRRHSRSDDDDDPGHPPPTALAVVRGLPCGAGQARAHPHRPDAGRARRPRPHGPARRPRGVSLR